MKTSKNGFFVLINPQPTKGFKVLSGPHKTRSDADLACQEVNANLTQEPFAYVRAPQSAAMARRWQGL